MSRDINNAQDILDSRDLIKRLAELQDDLDSLNEEIAETQEGLEEASELDAGDGADPQVSHREEAQAKLAEANEALAAWPDQEEYDTLKALCEEGENTTPDWPHGVALIRDSYFREYAEEFADDIGAINKDSTWPMNHIDWEAAAKELQQDYTELDYNGVTYWVR